MRRSRGFTLVELLVVMAVIGALPAAIAAFRKPAYVVRDGAAGSIGVGIGGTFRPLTYTNGAVPEIAGHPCLGILPPLYPEWLGDRSFAEAHGCRFPYVAGAMANGIATVAMVAELARQYAGCLCLALFWYLDLKFTEVLKEINPRDLP